MIRVNDDWVIDVDTCYVPMKDLHRKKAVKQRDGTETEADAYGNAIGYFTSLKGAVKAIAREDYKNALTGRETALNEAIKLMDATLTKFERIIERISE